MFAWKNYIWSGVPIDVCPYVKNELKFSIFSWVTGVSGILESDFWYRNWVSLEVPDHNQEKGGNQFDGSCKKATSSLNYFLIYCSLKIPPISLVGSILGLNSKARIFENMGFAVCDGQQGTFI